MDQTKIRTESASRNLTISEYRAFRKKHRGRFKLNGCQPLHQSGQDLIDSNLSQASALLNVLAITLPDAQCEPTSQLLVVALDGINNLIEHAIYEMDLERERD